MMSVREARPIMPRVQPEFQHGLPYVAAAQPAARIYPVAISQRNLKNWPIYNAETGYEIGNDGGHTYSVVQSKGEVLKRIYKVFMAGAMPRIITLIMAGISFGGSKKPTDLSITNT